MRLTDEAKNEFYSILNYAKTNEVSLYLDGYRSNYDEIKRTYICESAHYMADYVFDDNGNLTEVAFTNLRPGKGRVVHKKNIGRNPEQH